jgi:DNA-binding MarR family transcriptional regulator
LDYDLEMPYPAAAESWRQTHLGRLLEMAGQRFEARVLALMAAAHSQITRHLPLAGCSLTELASRAGITKQAMGKLVDQCTAWDLVQRLPDPRDARALRVLFTASGQLWLAAYQQAVQQAEAEFRQAVGTDVATVVQLGLEVYAS